MQIKIILYVIIPNKETLSYDILSEHPERYVECSCNVVPDLELDLQVQNLFSNYHELHADYVKFIHLRPSVEGDIVKIPFYCLVPYNEYNIKNSYKIPCKEYAKFIPDIRKILNII